MNKKQKERFKVYLINKSRKPKDENWAINYAKELYKTLSPKLTVKYSLK